MFGPEIVSSLSHGGYTLLFIAFLSLVALAIAAERIVACWGVIERSRALAEQVTRMLLRRELEQARAACERSRAPASELFRAGFARVAQANGASKGAAREGGKESLAGAVEGAVERERMALLLKLKRNLWVLGTIATISPFVGLFGTVVGIRQAFSAMAAAGTGGFAVVADGISAALVATAAGIFVAIEAVVLYNYFQARLGRVGAELRLLSEEFVELLLEQEGAPRDGELPAP